MKSKSTFRYFTVAVLLTSSLTVFGQYAPGVPANFGIDGDVISGYRQNGNFQANNTDDWFKKSTGANLGNGIIDTAGTNYAKSMIAAGNNYTLTRGMIYSQYSNQGGYLMLDARYGRDEFGYSYANGQKDFTTYTNGSKNGDNPVSWVTTPTGSSVANKSDIIDTYIHMRRNGIILNNTNPSPLILALGVSTVGNTGERYVDFELFRDRIEYNTTTGVFSNSGSASTGGHSAWEFNPDGSIQSIGDLSVSFAFGNGVVSDISIYIWTSSAVYNTTDPARFNFVSGEFWGNGNNPAWGYAKIIPDGGNPAFSAWGSASTTSYTGPDWGTTSKAIGNAGSNYNSTQYAAGDFAEVGIDLTSLGIDPALSVGQNPCSPPFTRVMAKTRASSTFTSALQDFTGPYLFLDAPTGPSKILPPATITCNQPTTTLSARDIIAGAVYQWSTTDGYIVSDPNQPTITVNKAGKYYLTAAIVEGCNTNTDSTTVLSDYYKPVASVNVLGTLNINDPLSYVTIQGGDVAASEYNTPFGNSTGLSWQWTGPIGGVGSPTNRVTNATKVGTYMLEVTETRNGCKDIAFGVVAAMSTLPVKITEFSATKKENDHVKINWKVMDETPSTVELMRSYSGKDFSVIAIELPLSANQEASYNDNVANRNGNKVYYQLRVTEQSGTIVYSKIINITFGTTNSSPMVLSPNPATNYTVIGITSTTATTGQIQLVDMAGRMMQQKNVRMEKGANQIMLTELEKLKPGIYMVRIVMEGEFKTQKLLIQ